MELKAKLIDRLQCRQTFSSLSIDSEDRREKIVIDEIQVAISEWESEELILIFESAIPCSVCNRVAWPEEKTQEILEPASKTGVLPVF